MQQTDNMSVPTLTGRPLPEEIVRLNASTRGRPVFWIHAAAGGNSIGQYQRLADVSERPFYAIKPPRIDIRRYWLSGIEARASWYMALIKAVDPVGPYDLGGYSMGTTLSYEVARQLIATGHQVRTLMLIDPTDFDCVLQWAAAFNGSDAAARSVLLRTMNFCLLSDGWESGRDGVDNLIHRDEVAGHPTMAEFTRHLVDLGMSRGLTLSQEQFMLRAIQDHQLVESLASQPWRGVITEQQGMEGIIFLNRSRAMHGAAAPWILMDETMCRDIERDYNRDWLSKCSHFRQVEIDCSTHFMFFTEAASLQPCVDICRQRYQVN